LWGKKIEMSCCINTYKADIPGCVDSIIFDIGLAEEAEYIFKLTLQSGAIVSIAVITDNEGKFQLDREELYWNYGTGVVSLEIYQGLEIIEIVCVDGYDSISSDRIELHFIPLSVLYDDFMLNCEVLKTYSLPECCTPSTGGGGQGPPGPPGPAGPAGATGPQGPAGQDALDIGICIIPSTPTVVTGTTETSVAQFLITPADWSDFDALICAFHFTNKSTSTSHTANIRVRIGNSSTFTSNTVFKTFSQTAAQRSGNYECKFYRVDNNLESPWGAGVITGPTDVITGNSNLLQTSAVDFTNNIYVDVSVQLGDAAATITFRMAALIPIAKL
jgi:hypothetical protein